MASRKPAGTGAALASALLFGITTPLAKLLLGSAPPLLIAGLLYVGAGAGLSLWLLLTDWRHTRPALPRADWPWLAAAIGVGGIAAPALLMQGLTEASAASASLLLNLEAVFTAGLAWLAFREHASRRVVSGFAVILMGGVLLAWPGAGDTSLPTRAALLIAGACLCWALDNNLTRRISAGDARLIGAIKGLAAGATNSALALGLGAKLPTAAPLGAVLLLGLLGYGVSVVLYIQALRHLGTARTGAYFATAPFIGGALALTLSGQTPPLLFWPATACMALGVWLHLTERHQHEHGHAPMVHTHEHGHDEHHQHEHGPEWDGREPHVHEHRHGPLRHSHVHFPDIHHQHPH